ncbi:MAG: response regulator transcription factor [Spirochaetales bacterium]|nr:response regulator transcription factor [Spirochaetales bacterium]
MRILIADDQERARHSLKALLATSLTNPEIWEAGSGSEAVRLAEELQPDVIVMDVRMPDIDGLVATRSVKSRWPEIRVMVLSMYPGYREKARAAGADLFVNKGESPERLLDALSSLM